MLKKELGIDNINAVPKVTKVVVSVGLSQGLKDPKVLETVEQTLTRITGQKPVKAKAKKSISNFKIREGMVVGTMVTLRGQRMWDFLTRLTQTTFPRIRDFRGLGTKSFDGRGNYTLGIKEQMIFPEINYDRIDKVRGMDIIVTTTATTDDEARELLREARVLPPQVVALDGLGEDAAHLLGVPGLGDVAVDVAERVGDLRDPPLPVAHERYRQPHPARDPVRGERRAVSRTVRSAVLRARSRDPARRASLGRRALALAPQADRR